MTSMSGQIKIFDGLIGVQEISRLYSFVLSSKYVIGWQDMMRTGDLKAYLHSIYSREDVDSLGFLGLLTDTEVAPFLEGMELSRAIVNMSVPSNVHFAHGHPEDLVLLYYVNPEWQPHYHGETNFYTFDGTEIQHSVMFKPGRIVLFDAKLPHAVRPQSSAGPDYRFTLALTFRKK